MPSQHQEPVLPVSNQDVYELEGIPEIAHDEYYEFYVWGKDDFCARALRLDSADLKVWEEALQAEQTNNRFQKFADFTHIRARISFRCDNLLPKGVPQKQQLPFIPAYLALLARRRLMLAPYNFAQQVEEKLKVTHFSLLDQDRARIPAGFSITLLRRAVYDSLLKHSLSPLNVIGAADMPLNLCHIRPAFSNPWSRSRRRRNMSAMGHNIMSEVEERWIELANPLLLDPWERLRGRIGLFTVNEKGEAIYPYYTPQSLRRTQSTSGLRRKTKRIPRRRHSFNEREKWHYDIPWLGEAPSENTYTVVESASSTSLTGSLTQSSRSISSTSRSSASKALPDTYFIVVGWFPKRHTEPKEMLMEFWPGEHFLRWLRAYITVLRGWRSILSFKTVQGFSLYQCDPIRNAHLDYEPSEAAKATLAQFFKAYSRRLPYFSWRTYLEKDTAESQAWYTWTKNNLSTETRTPSKPQLSLKLELQWSQTRLTIAALLPLLLSFVFGSWYTIKYDDAQSAYTISSYIVTSGAFIIALLAVLSSLKDG